MDIGNALRKSWREDITILAVVSNTVKAVYGKDIEIQSVKILGKKVIIKTWNSLINSELQLLEWVIRETSIKKLTIMWVNISNECVFRFI